VPSCWASAEIFSAQDDVLGVLAETGEAEAFLGSALAQAP